jgi:hypothetical protein
VAEILEKSLRYGDVTDRQHGYVDSLLKAAEAPKAARETLDLSRINAMFAIAAANLKKPFAIFATYKPDPRDPTGKRQIVDQEFRVSQAPAGGKNPGSLYVKRAGVYQGKISADGVFSAGAGEYHPDVKKALTAFSADPAAAAIAYGQATGNCCYCARELTDARSVTAGYGPICAAKWGLPWGVEAIACEEVE